VLALLDGPVEVATKGAETALSTLAQSVLGAITVLAVAVAIWAVKKLSSTHDERTKDAKESAEKYEKLLEKMLEVQSGMSKAIDAVTTAENAGTAVSREQNIALAQIKQTLEGTIRDAIRDSRRGSGYRDDQSIRPQPAPRETPPVTRKQGDPPPPQPGGTKRFGRY
jgi:hypothetical protein